MSDLLKLAKPRLVGVTENTRHRLRNAPVLDRLLFRTSLVGECWLWLGTRCHKGYGHIRLDNNGPIRLVHRVAYEQMVALIPEGLEIDHLCGVRHCVNPAHLEAVSRLENVRRALPNHAWATRDRCHRGHPFDEANTAVDFRRPRTRLCRACQRERSRAYLARRRAAQCAT